MAVSTDIVRTYRAPRRVVRDLLARGPREDRALAFLMVACLLIFVAQWPRLSREAFLAPEIPLEARMGGALMGWIFVAPLLAYGLAALTRLVARVLGGQGSFYSARLALFWSLLAATPLFLLNGLVAGFVGPGPGHMATGILSSTVFLAFWGLALVETEGQSAVVPDQGRQ